MNRNIEESLLSLWNGMSHLLLNSSKTKEVVTDFHRTSTPHILVNTQGSDIEMADSFKYLGVHLDEKWTDLTTLMPCTRRVRVACAC